MLVGLIIDMLKHLAFREEKKRKKEMLMIMIMISMKLCILLMKLCFSNIWTIAIVG
jgi:hypothetical protein